MNRATLVLGNGFDKHVCLASSFKDFFTIKLLKNGQFIKKNTNLLYYIFYIAFFSNRYSSFDVLKRINNENPNWMDVETYLKRIATNEEYHDLIFGIYKRHYAKTIEEINNYPNSLAKDVVLILKAKNISNTLTESDFGQIFLDDLKEFEEDFKNYLLNEISLMSNYDKDRQKLIEKIVFSCFQNGLGFLKIVNFNYTTFHAENFSVANVHGTLDSKIVIGYDSTSQAVEPTDYYSLSKEWQKIDIQYMISMDGKQAIMFYGHSIGEQDYPIFFEMFDDCKLENKGIYLLFCHSLKGNQLDLYKINVSKMIDAYGRRQLPNDSRNTFLTKLKQNNLVKFIYID